MSYVVYILQSNKNRHYIGFTSSLEQRLVQHNRKHHGSTYRIEEKWEILISREFESKQEAMEKEKYLKSLKNYRNAIKHLEAIPPTGKMTAGSEHSAHAGLVPLTRKGSLVRIHERPLGASDPGGFFNFKLLLIQRLPPVHFHV